MPLSYIILFYMLVGKKMFLTILIISITFRTETELQVRIILFCPSADGTFMLGHPSGTINLLVIDSLSVDLFWCDPFHILR